MNAAARGLGDLDSTRPQSRAERRAEAARIHAEQQQRSDDAANEPPTDESPARTVPPVTLPTKAKKAKRPFSTQLPATTIDRLDWAQRHGAPLTDTVDAAITMYLDAAGVPTPDANGKMPG
jgi:hypothetical protein